MGLGLHGGGVETVRWLAGRGAQLVCTDLQDEKALTSSLEALKDLDIRFVLGRHRTQDFDEADIIVKNPAVPNSSSWLRGRTNVETDISLFLNTAQADIIAVTGSKGKSTVVSALHSILGGRLGGNIAVSPLSFVDNLVPGETVILELSSWQLADLKGRGLLRPALSCITNLMWDHQNKYDSFADYESDKRVIYENAGPTDWCVFPDDERGRQWAADCNAQVLLLGTSGKPEHPAEAIAWLDTDGRGWMQQQSEPEEILPRKPAVPGLPFRLNSLFAAAMARLRDCPAQAIQSALAGFGGVPYRMEMFQEYQGIRFYDDTAATMPDAAAAAIMAFRQPVILVAGGTDKNLDFAPFDAVACIPKRILLLDGTASAQWLPRLERLGAAVEGPFPHMETVVKRAWKLTAPGDIVLLSPGAASFGMFQHEFDRGDAFKRACRGIAEAGLELEEINKIQ